MKVTLLVWLDALSVSYRSQQQLAYNEEKKRVMYGKARAYHEQLKLLNDKDFLKANVRPTISDSRGEQNQDHAADLEFLQNDREARKRELLLLTQANRPRNKQLLLRAEPGERGRESRKTVCERRTTPSRSSVERKSTSGGGGQLAVAPGGHTAGTGRPSARCTRGQHTTSTSVSFAATGSGPGGAAAVSFGTATGQNHNHKPPRSSSPGRDVVSAAPLSARRGGKGGPEQSSRGGTSRGGADTGSVNVMGGCTTRTTCNNPTAKTISSRGVVWQKTRESASGSADLQKMMQDLGAPSAPPAKAVHPAGGGAGAGGGTATSSSSQAGNSGVKGLGAWLNRVGTSQFGAGEGEGDRDQPPGTHQQHSGPFDPSAAVARQPSTRSRNSSPSPNKARRLLGAGGGARNGTGAGAK